MKNVLLIGLGRFGTNIAMELNKLGHQVMAIDEDEEKVNNVLPYVTDAQIGDTTNEAYMKTLGVADYDVCIVTIGESFQSLLETTALLKELGAKRVVSRASRDRDERFLRRMGADAIVYPEKQMASWTAIRYTENHVLDFMEIDRDYSIMTVLTPDEWIGKTVGELNVRKKYGINIIALRINGKLSMNVSVDTELTKGANIMVVGKLTDLQKVF